MVLGKTTTPLRVMVTGANGFVGSSLCHMLHHQGHHVVGTTRTPHHVEQYEQMVIGELNAKTDCYEALKKIDVVVHSAARVHVLYDTVADPISEFRQVNVEASANLARQAIEAGVKRMIFISTIGVLGNYSLAPFCETDEPQPSNAYAVTKWEAEQKLNDIAKSSGLEMVMIRPPLVYGPGVKANFYRLMDHVAKGKPLPFGRVVNARDFVSVKNLSHLISVCLAHPKASGELFLVADRESVSTPQLIRKLAQHLGVYPRLLPVPEILLHWGARLLQKERFYHSVCSSLQIDTAKAWQLLDWQPMQTLDEGLGETVAWYKQQKEDMA